MAKMDWEDVRQFILNDREIREYFLALAEKSTMRGTGYTLSSEPASEMSVPSAKTQNATLEKNIQVLKAENDALRREISAMRIRASELEAESEKSRRAAMAAQSELKSAVGKLTTFQPICNAMETYQSLGEKTRAAMRNIFRTASPDGFISCGTQKNSLANLWDYGRTLAANGSADCIKIDSLFEYFISLYNLTFEQPVYTLIEPKIGDRFDEDLHVCLARGQRISNISGVLLRGYRVNGKTANKALVK